MCFDQWGQNKTSDTSKLLTDRQPDKLPIRNINDVMVKLHFMTRVGHTLL